MVSWEIGGVRKLYSGIARPEPKENDENRSRGEMRRTLIGSLIVSRWNPAGP